MAARSGLLASRCFSVFYCQKLEQIPFLRTAYLHEIFDENSEGLLVEEGLAEAMG